MASEEAMNVEEPSYEQVSEYSLHRFPGISHLIDLIFPRKKTNLSLDSEIMFQEIKN